MVVHAAVCSPEKGLVSAVSAALMQGPRTAPMRAGGRAQEARTWLDQDTALDREDARTPWLRMFGAGPLPR